MDFLYLAVEHDGWDAPHQQEREEQRIDVLLEKVSAPSGGDWARHGLLLCH